MKQICLISLAILALALPARSQTADTPSIADRLTAARRQLDLDQFRDCIRNCDGVIQQLDPARESDWLAWTLAHATLAAAYAGLGSDRNLKDGGEERRWFEKALKAVDRGLLVAEGKEAAIHEAQPDRVAKLLEVRGSIYSSMSVIHGIKPGEAMENWQMARITLEAALKAAKTPIFQASVHRAVARAFVREGGHSRDLALFQRAAWNAEKALELVGDDPAGKLIRARSQVLLASTLILPLHFKGINDVSHPDMIRGEQMFKAASAIFDELVPGTQDARDARQYLADFNKSRGIQSWNSIARMANGMAPRGQSEAEAERQRQLRGMADENYRARQEGRPKPNPGVR